MKIRILAFLFFPVLHGETANFLQLTDLHYDSFYLQGSNEDEGCHRYRGSSGVEYAGKYGSHRCDSPIQLIDESLKFMSNLADLSFVILTGDSARHDMDSDIPRTPAQVKEAYTVVFNKIVHSFPNLVIIPTIGNNDLTRHNLIGKGPNEDFAYLWDLWKVVLPADQQESVLLGGYFSVSFRTLRVISINTLFYYRKNFKASDCHVGSLGSLQFDWLQDQLFQSRKMKQFVYFVGHIPPSVELYFHSCYHRYLKIVEDFQDIIKGQFYGHTNVDDFTLLPNPSFDKANTNSNHFFSKSIISKNKAIPNRYIGAYFEHPSIIPVYNPSFRVYQFDSLNGNLLNYSQYYADLELSNEKLKLEFIKEYSLLESYQMDSMDLKEWIELHDRLETDPELYRLFMKHKYVSSSA